jgi:RNA polymerase sigma-70 factor (ECF subfamily)
MTYATMTDLELVEAARQNQDKRAFAILLQRYQRPLYNYILRMIGQAAEAEELFQETFLRIYQNLEHFRGGASFSPWAYRIAHNICIDALRSPRKRLFTSLDAEYGESNQSLEDVLEGRSPNPEDELYRQQLAFHIQEAVEKLPAAIRSVFVLYQYQHLPYEQIAETLSIPLGTVKSRMHTALRKLSHSLRQFSDSGIDPRELYEQQKAQEKNQSSD